MIKSVVGYSSVRGIDFFLWSWVEINLVATNFKDNVFWPVPFKSLQYEHNVFLDVTTNWWVGISGLTPNNSDKCIAVPSVLLTMKYLGCACLYRDRSQSYIYQVLQTIQMKLILLCVWAEPTVLGCAKTALKFIYKI